MNYIPYPRVDKDTHTDLTRWRGLPNKKEGDWKILKEYLACNCRWKDALHRIPKCWFSELPQGDNYALDVEHFRPKKQADPLKQADVDIIEKITGFPLLQDNTKGGKYPWLEFDYRNYRLVTATCNRAGAKHIYFPIFNNTQRLADPSLPWEQREYPLFLDPTNQHDASLLLVTPDGKIHPRTPKTKLGQADINNLPATWTNDAFNYVRAVVTIKMYRLDHDFFIGGRKEVYEDTESNLDLLLFAINSENETIIGKMIKKLVKCIIPSAGFSLAAKCAMINYAPPAGSDPQTVDIFNETVQSILTQVEQITHNSIKTNWDKP